MINSSCCGLLFASSMFYALDPMPGRLKALAGANPVTRQSDLPGYSTVGLRALSPGGCLALLLFAAASFAFAILSLAAQE